jgi:SAM-dependent methyltransferase
MDKTRFEDAADFFCGADTQQQLRYEVKGLRIVHCARCGLAFVNPRLRDQVRFDEVYTEDYGRKNRPAWRRTLSRAKRWLVRPFRGRSGWEWQALFVARSLCQAHGQVPGRVRLLEIGSGNGSFLSVLRERFPHWDLAGIEPSEHWARVCREERGLPVQCGLLEEVGFPPGSFDAVHLWQVLEHFPDPVGSMERLRACLKPGGLLTLRTPNYNCLTRRRKGTGWKDWWPEQHLYYFTHATLERLLTETGFRRVWPRRIPFWRDWSSTLLVAARAE